MIKKLSWIAAIGIGVGIIASTLAATLVADEGGGFDFWRAFSLAESCPKDTQAATGAPERRWAWEGGDSVVIALPATVHYRGGEGDDVIARGSPEAIAHISVSGGTITTSCDGFAGGSKIDITLPGRVFSRVGLTGSAKITMENINQTDFAADITGSGSINVSGSSKNVAITIKGSGDAKFADLVMEQLAVNISGSGNAEAAPQKAADIAIKGSGDVKLLSRPAQLNTVIKGSGRIIQPSGVQSGN